MENRNSPFAPSEPLETEQRAKMFAALSDPTRLRIVELLATCDELSGSEIANQVGVSLALFCHHSRTLAEAGLIHIRREGQTKFNSLNRELLTRCFSSLNGLAAPPSPSHSSSSSPLSPAPLNPESKLN